MSGRRAVGIGATAALCVGIGLAAGLDAAGHVDRFYTSPPVHEARAMPVAESSPYDWDMQPVQSTTWASATSGQSVAIVGEGRGDGSDLTEIDRAVEHAGAVRVHRPRHSVRAERDVEEPAEADLPSVEPDPTA